MASTRVSARQFASAVLPADKPDPVRYRTERQTDRTERQTDLLLSTLVAYLRALGVDAELTVKVPGGKTIRHRLTDPREEDR